VLCSAVLFSASEPSLPFPAFLPGCPCDSGRSRYSTSTSTMPLHQCLLLNACSLLAAHCSLLAACCLGRSNPQRPHSPHFFSRFSAVHLHLVRFCFLFPFFFMIDASVTSHLPNQIRSSSPPVILLSSSLGISLLPTFLLPFLPFLAFRIQGSVPLPWCFQSFQSGGKTLALWPSSSRCSAH